MKILLLAGAGTSIELGVPGMAGMATEFVAHCQQWGVEPDLVDKIMGDRLDVEHLIEGLDRICLARTSLEAIGQDAASFSRVDKIRAEVEWFVQHSAERVAARDAQLLWGPVLRTCEFTNVTFVTTNYDRAIELAANAERVQLDDGFGPFAEGETAPWVGFNPVAANPPLVKLHGSTDWYAEGESGSPTKLRHPMPLFGRSTLRLADGHQLGSALVLPSREKLLTRAPYPRLSQTFLNATDCCDLAVFVGSSLRDFHIRGAAETVARRAPVFVINPEGDSYGVEGALAIAQRASTFLISTLPAALMNADPGAILAKAVTSRDVGTDGILPAVKQALDTTAEISLRCRAIEALDEQGATLDPFWLRQLLADVEPTVARYSLGLITTSPACGVLIEAAARSAHFVDAAFREDLELLKLVASRRV